MNFIKLRCFFHLLKYQYKIKFVNVNFYVFKFKHLIYKILYCKKNHKFKIIKQKTKIFDILEYKKF